MTIGKIFAIDLHGGGSRGILQAAILKNINNIFFQKTGGLSMNKYITHAGGVSIGTVNLMNLLKYDDTKELVNFYLNHINKVLIPYGYSKGVFQAKYSDINIANLLKEQFEDVTFANLQSKAKILLSSFNTHYNSQTLWSNFGTEEMRKLHPGYVWNINDYRVADAMKASMSVPGIFNAHMMEYSKLNVDHSVILRQCMYEIDGGVLFNTTLPHLLHGIECIEERSLKDVFVLSIGCGELNVDLSHLYNSGLINYGKNAPEALATWKNAQDSNLIYNTLTRLKYAGGKGILINPLISKDDYFNFLNDDKATLEGFVEIADNYCELNKDEFNILVDQLIEHLGLENYTMGY